MSCDYCTNPLYVGTKCKNCGREAAQQEPLATLFGSLPVYDTTPPAAQRQWVGLTDGERDAIRFSIPTKAVTQRDFELARAIEAKLKEKNT